MVLIFVFLDGCILYIGLMLEVKDGKFWVFLILINLDCEGGLVLEVKDGKFWVLLILINLDCGGMLVLEVKDGMFCVLLIWNSLDCEVGGFCGNGGCLGDGICLMGDRNVGVVCVLVEIFLFFEMFEW